MVVKYFVKIIVILKLLLQQYLFGLPQSVEILVGEARSSS